MKKRTIIALLVIIIVISFIVIIFINNKPDIKYITNEEWVNDYSSVDKNEVQYDSNTTIEEIKDRTGVLGDTSLYQIDKEYDGRKVLNIKNEIQYKVAFSGIIQQELPKIEEVDKIMNENHPLKTGIWIERKSQNKFLELLKGNVQSSYNINKEGYLIIESKEEQNENDKKLEELINSNKLILVTISSIYYEVDSETGKIQEYPFEKLDPYKAYDCIVNDNNIIVVITTNLANKLTNEQILKELLQI